MNRIAIRSHRLALSAIVVLTSSTAASATTITFDGYFGCGLRFSDVVDQGQAALDELSPFIDYYNQTRAYVAQLRADKDALFAQVGCVDLQCFVFRANGLEMDEYMLIQEELLTVDAILTSMVTVPVIEGFSDFHDLENCDSPQFRGAMATPQQIGRVATSVHQEDEGDHKKQQEDECRELLFDIIIESKLAEDYHELADKNAEKVVAANDQMNQDIQAASDAKTSREYWPHCLSAITQAGILATELTLYISNTSNAIAAAQQAASYWEEYKLLCP